MKKCEGKRQRWDVTKETHPFLRSRYFLALRPPSPLYLYIYRYRIILLLLARLSCKWNWCLVNKFSYHFVVVVVVVDCIRLSLVFINISLTLHTMSLPFRYSIFVFYKSSSPLSSIISIRIIYRQFHSGAHLLFQFVVRLFILRASAVAKGQRHSLSNQFIFVGLVDAFLKFHYSSNHFQLTLSILVIHRWSSTEFVHFSSIFGRTATHPYVSRCSTLLPKHFVDCLFRKLLHS